MPRFICYVLAIQKQKVLGLTYNGYELKMVEQQQQANVVAQEEAPAPADEPADGSSADGSATADEAATADSRATGPVAAWAGMTPPSMTDSPASPVSPVRTILRN